MDGRTLRSLTKYFLLWKVFLFLVIILTPGPGYDTSTTLLGAAHGHEDTEFNVQEGSKQDASAVVGSTVLPLFAHKLVRWDSIYFVNIAERGYLFEQEWAFGYPSTLRLLSKLVLGRSPGAVEISCVGIALSHISHYLSVLVLYALCKTISTDKSKVTDNIAFLSAFLHIVCPAGAFLSAPYGEPVFSLLNFTGFYTYMSARLDDTNGKLFHRDLKIFVSGTLFAIATTVRSNGVLSGMLFAYDAVVGLMGVVRSGISFPLIRRLAFVFLGGSLILIGTVGPQYVAYKIYCQDAVAPRSWCNNTIPSIYTWVQSYYWNVGFLRYWTISNIPLFILAMPMLLILSWSSIGVLTSRTSKPSNSRSQSRETDTQLQACLSRLALPQLTLAVMALFSYHVQIITRLSSGYPLWYWYLASQIVGGTASRESSLILGRGTVVRGMVMYAVVQGALFGSFLPPA